MNEFSREAHERSKGRREQHEQQILDAIRRFGPLNTDEMEVRTGITHQSASPLVLDLRRRGVLEQAGKRKTRSDCWAAVWGFANGKGPQTQPLPALPVYVASAGSGGTQEGLFEAVPEPVAPALRASDYACGHVTTSKGVSTPCDLTFTELRSTLFESRFVEGYCPKHHWTEGSLIRPGEYPVGWGTSGTPAAKTSKPKPYRRRRKG